jgi:hypothetical protein
MNGRRWCAASLALVAGSGLALVAPAGPAVAAQTLGAQVSSLHAEGKNWRAELAPSLSTLSGARNLTGKLSGSVAAQTVTLPAGIELSGDTTIVAKEIIVTGGTLRVDGHGHTLRLYPIATLGSAPGSAPGSAKAAVHSVITIDTSGRTGQRGGNGGNGSDGSGGLSGLDGWDAWDPSVCSGYSGGNGSEGGWGTGGFPGGSGGGGTDAGNITVDIPDGSPNAYQLIARGGAGGQGGDGGWGGSGGWGGNGGNGGDGYNGECYGGSIGFGGYGGSGGGGGYGGPGGSGGSGGGGGKGGNIEVTMPASYDPEQLTIDNDGGDGGSGGWFGLGGWGGSGGIRGYGGYTWYFGHNEPDGYDGWPGGAGSSGFFGAQGQKGTKGNKKVNTRFECLPSVVAVDDPPLADHPTKIVGIGTVRCNGKANIDITVKLFSDKAGRPTVLKAQDQKVFFDIPANSAQQLRVDFLCSTSNFETGTTWYAEVHYKADERTGTGFPPHLEGRSTSPLFLFNIQC